MHSVYYYPSPQKSNKRVSYFTNPSWIKLKHLIAFSHSPLLSKVSAFLKAFQFPKCEDFCTVLHMLFPLPEILSPRVCLEKSHGNKGELNRIFFFSFKSVFERAILRDICICCIYVT